MLHSLRARLLISHMLPVLIIAPITAFVLLYLFESQYLLNDLASELVTQSELIRYFTQENRQLWQNSAEAGKVINQLNRSIPARMMLLDAQGRMLGSSLTADQNRIGQFVDMPVVVQALSKQTTWLADYNPFIGHNIVDVAVPVIDSLGKLLGIIRLSYTIDTVEQQLIPVRWILGLAVVIAVILAVILSLFLAHSLSTPLHELTLAAQQLIPGQQPQPLRERGPDDLQILAKSFNQMSNRLYEMEQERRTLLANFVHELGTPLGAIKAASQALQEGAVSDPQLGVELAEGINIQVDQFRRVLDDLTILQEAQLRPLSLHLQAVHIDELVERICLAYAYLVQQKSIQLTYDVPYPLPTLQADPQRLQQIISNLLHNAYKYTPRNGRISVRVRCEHLRIETICLEVTDTGPGIKPEDQEQIFHMFYRSPSHKRHYEGMGIGLTVARQLAESHGGSLTVSSIPGRGTTFTLSLPVSSHPS